MKQSESCPPLLDTLKAETEKAEALERAMRGYCLGCINANPPNIKQKDKFPLLVQCEYFSPGVFASSENVKRKCNHWQFDYERFKEV